jgi:putative transposase
VSATTVRKILHEEGRTEGERDRPRFVGTVCRECLDWLLVLNRRHLEHVLRVFVDHYNAHRPHRSLNLTPIATDHERPLASSRDVKRRDRLGGLIHEYSHAT